MNYEQFISAMCFIEGKKSQIKRGDMKEAMKNLAVLEAAHRIKLHLEGTSPVGPFYHLEKAVQKIVSKELKKRKTSKKK